MSGRIGNGWELFKQSWTVLRQDKELMIFPILSSVACLLVIASFVAPFLIVPEWGQQVLHAAGNQAEDGGQATLQRALYLGVMFLFYLVNYFVIAFFNTALVSCAIIRFSGGDPTLKDGLRSASRRLPQILGWALLSATIGMLLKAVEERAGIVGQFVVRLIGVLWSVASYLVVPVLAVEGLGPMGAVKRSVVLLKKCWGEGLVGNFSMGVVSVLLYLPAMLLMVAGPVLSFTMESLVPGIALVGLGVIWLIGVCILMSTMHQIFLAGLYVFAAEDRVPSGFSQDLMVHAFRKK